MKRLFTPNISRKGRIIRASIAVVLLVGSIILVPVSLSIAIPTAASGAFALFEALRGWCVLRACGIKTQL